MHNSFKSAINIMGTKQYGASLESAYAEPYTSGTFYIWFGSVPSGIVPVLQSFNSTINSVDEIQNITSAFCTGVTPPGGTLNVVEYTGIGGVKWGVPGSIDYGRTITLKFAEMFYLPISDIFSAWFRMIRDNRTGLSNLATGQYLQTQYSGTLIYWTTAPNGVDVQFYAAYDGVFPLKDPQDLFTSDVETVDKQDIELEFNINKVFRDSWVYDICVSKTMFMKSTHDALISTYKSGKGAFR